MAIKQKLKNILLAGLFAVSFITSVTVLLPQPDAAAACAAGSANCCAGVTTSIISCTQPGGSSSSDVTQSGVWGILILAINILTAGVGIAAIGGIIYGAILYTSAGGSQEQVKKAVTILTNVVIGIVAYALMWSALNFLIPGGVFK